MEFKLWLQEMSYTGDDDNPYYNLDKSILNHPDFRGFHCSRLDNPQGYIEIEYADTWFPTIIEHLPYDLRVKLSGIGIDLYDIPDKYSEEFEEWASDIERFLEDNGIRWLFVSHKQPFGHHRQGLGAKYGSNCFYVLIPGKNLLMYENDPAELDASAIMFHVSNPPKLIPLQEAD